MVYQNYIKNSCLTVKDAKKNKMISKISKIFKKI